MPDDDFFIGYASTPPGLRRWLRSAAACALLAMLSAAVLIAARQRSPGDAAWQSGAEIEIEGVYVESPYPMLLAGDQTFLLVGVGKVGASLASVKPGERVRVSGTRLRRMNLALLEATAFDATGLSDRRRSPEFPAPSPGTPGEGWGEGSARLMSETPGSGLARTLTLPSPGVPGEGNRGRGFRGEILDPKCFAGAMKPGDGKAHKACAALCIRGGIPPAFRSGGELFVLVDPQLERFDAAGLEAVIAHIGEDVNLIGRIVALGRMRLLAVDPGTIRRRAP